MPVALAALFHAGALKIRCVVKGCNMTLIKYINLSYESLWLPISYIISTY